MVRAERRPAETPVRFRRMIVAHSYKFVFVHPQKTGGTSVSFALDPFLAWDDVVLGGTPRGQAIDQAFGDRFGLRKHSTVAEIERVCGRAVTENYFVFATVRRPLERICSFYNFVGHKLNRASAQTGIPLAGMLAHIERHPNAVKRHPALGWHASRLFLKARDFSEFIHAEFTQGQGFLPLTDHLESGADGRVHCQAYRIEDSATWVPQLAERLGGEFDLGRRNTSNAIVAADSVSAEDRRFIEERYAADYAAFGY
jgi:Sulfotransferase family